jgi:hypothetical protein
VGRICARLWLRERMRGGAAQLEAVRYYEGRELNETGHCV